MRECELIKKIQKQVGRLPEEVVRGIGDDCAVLDTGRDEYTLWAQDMLIEGTHFDLKKAGYKEIGRKAVAVNISDIAAMGGRPEYVLVSLGLPAKIRTVDIKAISNGIFGILNDFNVKLLGGDTVKSDKIVIDISIMGAVKKKNITFRSGAKPGDFILITGPVRNGRREHLTFIPRLKEARYLTENHKINAMIDTSDGIAPDIIRICDESKTGCVIYRDALPLSKGLTLTDALYYGESFELMFTMSPREAQKLLTGSGEDKKGSGFFVIGEVTVKKKGRIIVDKDRSSENLRLEGYRHL